MKILNKAIFEHTISAIIFTIFLIVFAFVITYKYIESNIHNSYNENNFMIQIDPKINKTLDILTDIEGLNSKSNVINITNNNNVKKKYQVLLSPNNSDEEYIRVGIDNVLIRNLSKFEKKDNKYILGEYSLQANQTRIHNIKMWQDKKEQNKKINVNFKLEVKILD